MSKLFQYDDGTKTLFIGVSLIKNNWLRRIAMVLLFFPAIVGFTAFHVLFAAMLIVFVALRAVFYPIKCAAGLARSFRLNWKAPYRPET